MSRKIIPSVVLAALASFSTLALADPPAVVGRISAVQGQVTLVGSDDGDGEPVAASLNWPVTGANHLNTGRGARTEFRVGSTAVRLDADSDLEILDMDDDLLRLRLNYGSVSVRVRSPESLRDFELSTPQARVTLLEPGVVRVDVERIADTSQVYVLGGSARVEGAGTSMVVSNGRKVDVNSTDVSTGVAGRDGFDVWADERDRQAEAVVTSRYVSSGITGYEELDRNGSWTESVEYGPLWAPRNVGVDWAPYRDGRWTWLAPWGWTWVDNAPWGYAPSHYGRWVTVNSRWFWAPGRPSGRPVWAPALVGWVGGDGYSHQHRGPGLGWFPLSPRERYVPGYRVSNNYESRLTWNFNGRPYASRANRPDRRDGVTMLPREQFEGRHTVPVNRGGVVIPPRNFAQNAVPVAPPAPALSTRVVDPNRRGWQDRDGDGRPDRGGRGVGDGRFDRDGRDDRFTRNNGQQQPGRVITAPSQPQALPQAPGRPQVTNTLAPGQFGTPNAPAQTINPNDVAIELRPGYHSNRPSAQPPGAGAPGYPNRDRFNRDDDNGRRPARQRDDQREQREQRTAFQPQPQQPQPRPQPVQQPQPQPHFQPQQQPQQFQAPQRPPQAPQQAHQPPAQPQGQPAARNEPPRRNNEGQGQGRERGNRANLQ